MFSAAASAANSIIVAVKPTTTIAVARPSAVFMLLLPISRPGWSGSMLISDGERSKAAHQPEEGHAIRHRRCDRRRFLAGCQTRRGAGFWSRLVLRHADAECRPVCRDGRGGGQDDQDPAR